MIFYPLLVYRFISPFSLVPRKKDTPISEVSFCVQILMVKYYLLFYKARTTLRESNKHLSL